MQDGNENWLPQIKNEHFSKRLEATPLECAGADGMLFFNKQYFRNGKIFCLETLHVSFKYYYAVFN